MKNVINGDSSIPSCQQTGLVYPVKLIGVLSIFYLIFVIYGSLVPLHFVPIPFDRAITEFQNIHFLDLGIDSRADWVANLLLFIPLSFLYNQLATSNKTGAAKHVVSFVVLLVSIGLAFGIEFTQLFFPNRTVSQNDIWAESLGGGIGIACQYLWGAKLQIYLDRLWQQESRKTRLMRVLNVYLTILLAFSVLPLDLTISPVELYHKWQEGRIVLVPFGAFQGVLSEELYETLTDILVWVPAGFLWSLDKKYSILRITVMGGLAALFIEVAQLFVYSRITDITDVLTACIGTAVGALIVRKICIGFSEIETPNSKFWISLWIVWAMCILALFWFPYNFDFSMGTFSKAQAIIFRPLLENYYFGSEFHATNELLRKAAFFLPGGVIFGLAIRQNLTDKIINRKGGVAILFLALLVEVGQLFLPEKYADLTDVLIQTAGGYLGLVVIRWVLLGDSVTNKLLPVNSVKSPPVTSIIVKNINSAPGWRLQYIIFAGLIIIIGLISHLPFVPYNIRELIAPSVYGVFAVIGLSVAIEWFINGHYFFLQRCNLKNKQMLYLPLWILFHGGVSWVLLRLAVPLESIHDIVGSPVLGWFWEWELICRFLALHGAISLQIIGALILIFILRTAGRLELFFTWMLWSALLAWPLYWIVVSQAATDNLTELMHDGGTFVSSAQLASGLFFLFLAGSAISSLIQTKSHIFSTLLLSIFSIFVATACFWYGAEQVIVKYNKVFSAWQFLLSTDREHYAIGADLYFRFVVAFSLVLVSLSIIQTLFWKMGGNFYTRNRPA